VTVTTLEPTTIEHLEFTAPDMEIECDMKSCSAAARYAVRGVCGCLELVCALHMTKVIASIESALPCIFYCSKHPGFPERFCTKVRDFVESVQPI